MNNIISDKKSIRKIFLHSQQLMTNYEVIKESTLIRDTFFLFGNSMKGNYSLKDISYLHIFLPIIRFNEVNTYLIIEKLRIDYAHIKIVIPKTISDFGLEHFIYDQGLKLKENKWRINEPTEGKKIQPEDLDLVVIPMLACDVEGNRVGYGKGFYDRFLSKCKPEALKVGLAYHRPIKKISDVNKFDIKLNYCITPDHIYNF